MDTREFFDMCLPEPKLSADVRKVLLDIGYSVELDGGDVSIPRDAAIQLVARVARRYEISMGFGELSAVMAIGGVRSLQHGIPEAGICFATLWYTTVGKLITVDFSKKMP